MKKNISLLIILTFLSFVIKSQAQIINGNFESGRNSGWTEYSTKNFDLIATGSTFISTEIEAPVYPRSGSYMARIGGFQLEVNSISQVFTLPNVKPLYLVFYAQTRSSTGTDCAGVWVGAKISIFVNNQLISSAYLCKYNDIYQWTQYYIDMSAIAGETTQIVFQAESANSFWSYFYIDDVSLSSYTDIRDVKTTNSNIELEQNYPNPFNQTTSFKYSIPDNQFVSLKVYDFIGNELTTLVNEKKTAGKYEVAWNASSFRSGIYFYKLTTGTSEITKKLIFLK